MDVKEIALKLSAATAGLTPNKIALIVAVGLVFGAFPIYGCPPYCAAWPRLRSG